MAIASFGVGADESLAAVIGPLIEVPAMLACVGVMRYSRRWFSEERWESAIEKEERLEKVDKETAQNHEKGRSETVAEQPLSE